MNYKFCPFCGAAGTIAAQSNTHYQCSACGKDIWNNPKAAVSIVFIKDGQALFSKRAFEPNQGLYDFPGGFVEYGEDVFAAAVREVHEETGMAINTADLELLTVYTVNYTPGMTVVDVIMVASQWDGRFVAADDSSALEWHPFSFLETPSIAPDYPGLTAKLTNYIANTTK